jgi:hypothetical protein
MYITIFNIDFSFLNKTHHPAGWGNFHNRLFHLQDCPNVSSAIPILLGGSPRNFVFVINRSEYANPADSVNFSRIWGVGVLED